MKHFTTLLFIVLFSQVIFGQMSVNDPQSWCCDSQASIENVEYEVRTFGLYSEVSVSFDVYTNEPSHYDNDTQIEFRYNFKLDENAVFNDSWLWIEDYISLGEVYERGEGTTIYEEIVDRQQDPSILTKLTANTYNLNIYPLLPDSTRRVRLSYLIPLDYQNEKMLTSLPMQFLDDSEVYPSNISLTVYDDENWFHESINDTRWEKMEDGNGFSKYDYGSSLSHKTWIHFHPDTPGSNLYFGTYEEEDEKYYQLLYFPELSIEQHPDYHMILFDFDKDQTNRTSEEMLNSLRGSLENLDEYDYFIIGYNDFTTKFSSDDWMAATDTNINYVFDQIIENGVGDYSHLASMLPNCMDRIKSLDQNAHLHIVSSSIEFIDEDFAKSYLGDVVDFIDVSDLDLKISAFDFSTSKPWCNFDGSWARGNDHFYDRLTSLTRGEHYNLFQGHDIIEGLEANFANEKLTTQDFDFDIDITDGFTYSTYFDNLENDVLEFNKPIIATGKYHGEGDFNIQLNGLVGGELFSDEVQVASADAMLLDHKTKSAWHAEYILENEFDHDQDIIYDVIQTSIDERLLSYRTVFLCLEPDTITISDNNEGEDDGPLVGTTDEEFNNINVSVFPNPFTEYVTLEIPLDRISLNTDIHIEIFDMQGQLVENILEQANKTGEVFSVIWTPSDGLNDGLYLIRIYGEGFNYNTTVMYQK